MRSIQARALTTLAAAVAAATLAVGSAGAEGAPVAGQTFVNGLLAGDPLICPAMTPRLAKTLATLSGTSSCEASAAKIRSSLAREADAGTFAVISAALDLAELAVSEHAGELGSLKVWYGRGFTLKELVAELRGLPTEAGPLKVRVAKGPAAARKTPPNMIVIDIARSTPRTLVLYAEGASGTIWRATAPGGGIVRFAKTTVRGVGTPPKPPTAPVEQLDGQIGGSTLVLTRIPAGPFLGGTGEDPTSVLLVRSADGLFDQLLVGLMLFPQPAAAPGADPGTFVSSLITAVANGDGSATCALLHPDLAAAAEVEPADCGPQEKTVIVESTPPGLALPTADGTILRAFRDPTETPSFSGYYIARSSPTTYLITGAFIDLGEVVDALGDAGDIL